MSHGPFMGRAHALFNEVLGSFSHCARSSRPPRGALLARSFVNLSAVIQGLVVVAEAAIPTPHHVALSLSGVAAPGCEVKGLPS